MRRPLTAVGRARHLLAAFATACNIARALAEERLLARSPAYRAYRERVRWRLIPCLW